MNDYVSNGSPFDAARQQTESVLCCLPCRASDESTKTQKEDSIECD